MTGTFNNTKISVPGNQMFVLYETTSKLAIKGFMASIVENCIGYNNRKVPSTYQMQINIS